MLVDTYETKALRTAPVRPATNYNGHDLYLMMEVLTMAIRHGKLADRVKKQIFHGKPQDVSTSNYMVDRVLTGDQQDLLNAALGLIGEAAEVAQIIVAHVFDRQPLDQKHLEEELGDTMWYLPLAARGGKLYLNNVARFNNEKLLARYPDGFPSKTTD